MDAFGKSVFRMLKSNKGRFSANLIVVFLSVALTAGLGAMPDQYDISFGKNYKEGNAPDLVLKCESEDGFSDADISMLDDRSDVTACETYFVYDHAQEEDGEQKIYRIYIGDFEEMEIGRLEIVDGSYPVGALGCLAEQGNRNRTSYKVNEVINITGLDAIGISESIPVVVNGISDSPMYNSVQREQSYLSTDSETLYVDSIIYLDLSDTEAFFEEQLGTSFALPMTDAYVRLDSDHDYLSGDYDEEMSEKADEFEALFTDGDVTALTLEENTSYALFENYNDKVRSITYCLPLFFVVLAALMNFLTVTRLIKDERPEIGCYSSLGVSKKKIIMKYEFFSILSVAVGAAAGYLLGTPYFSYMMLPAFGAIFEMNGVTFGLFNLLGVIVAASMVAIAFLVTLITGLLYLKDSPATLFKSPSPKAGKKIWIEKIGSIWKRIPFSYKNSFRNIFRHKTNTILTAISVLGSTIILFVGLALLDISNAMEGDTLFGGVSDSMTSLSIVLIIFSVSMAATVIYCLANMNISDRVRELATLKVLGYHTRECSYYTFREIMLISSFSALLGVPAGLGVTYGIVIVFVGFGEIGDIQWYTYVGSYALVLAATLLVNILLYPRIKKIDMNASLKSLE
jgi:putative ABC transport system permease protein